MYVTKEVFNMVFWDKKKPAKKTIKKSSKKAAKKTVKKKASKKKVAKGVKKNSRGRSKCALAINSAEDEVRNTLNWLAVFAEEYNLEAEVVKKLKSKLQLIARKVGKIPC